MKSLGLIENGYFFEFRNKNSQNYKVTKLEFSEDELKPTYITISNWADHKSIDEKFQRVKKYYLLQEEFLNQIK